jgi:hypothetical protein
VIGYIAQANGSRAQAVHGTKLKTMLSVFAKFEQFLRWLGRQWPRIVLSLSVTLPGGIPRAYSLGIIVPAYFSPSRTASWEALNQAAARVPLVAIMNPNNGPTSSAQPDFIRTVNALRLSGGQMIGYVYSSYTARPLDQVKADVDRYDGFYTLDGFFIDEVTNDANEAHLDYYAALYDYIKSKRSTYMVVGNPGINTLANYITRPAFDRLVTFESNAGYTEYLPDSWTQKQPATTFSHLCYDAATAAIMTNYVQLAVKRNAGYVYVTDDRGNNPWDTLPSFWTAEVDLVETINRQTATNRPAVLSIAPQNEGQVQVQVSASPGRIILQTSPNLTNWGPIATNVSDSGKFQFSDGPTNGHPVRSYRTTQ